MKVFSNNIHLDTFSGRGVMPSVKLALDHVNEHDSVLRNYRLHMWWNDTEVRSKLQIRNEKVYYTARSHPLPQDIHVLPWRGHWGCLKIPPPQ